MTVSTIERKRGNVLIVGGGPAGLSAALALADHGFGVVLVEWSEKLGGHAANWACMATDVCAACSACLIPKWVEQVTDSEDIHVYMQAQVAACEPLGERFGITLHTYGDASPAAPPKNLKVDKILLAGGFSPFDPSRLPLLGYGSLEGVVTTADLNRILAKNRLDNFLPKGLERPRIAFVQCVGSRNREIGHGWCSQTCCRASTKMANRLLHLKPDLDITVFYIDMQLMGKEFRTFYEETKQNVRFLQGVPGEIFPDDATKRLTLVRRDAENRPAPESFDRVVLAVGQKPNDSVKRFSDMFGVPVTDDGFLFRPADGSAATPGVYVAGGCTGPTDIPTAKKQALAAVLHILKDSGVHVQGRAALVGDHPAGLKAAETLHGFGMDVTVLGHPDRDKSNKTDGLTHIQDSELHLLTRENEAFRLDVRHGTEKTFLSADLVIAAPNSPARIPPEAPENSVASAKFAPDEVGENDFHVAFLLDTSGPSDAPGVRRVLEQAMEARRKNFEATVLFRHLPVNGLDGQRIFDDARGAGIRFIRYGETAPEISKPNGRWMLETDDQALPGHRLSLSADALVFAERPTPLSTLARIEEITRLDRDCEGFLQANNTRHHPVSSFTKGVFFAGEARTELLPSEMHLESDAVAESALNWLETRGIQENFAVIDENRCVRCLTCYNVCSHRAISLREGKVPQMDPSLCWACGICLSSCPAMAISFALAEPGQPACQVIPPLPKVVAFLCRNSAALAWDKAEKKGLFLPKGIRKVVVPCAGSVCSNHMLTALLGGAEKVIVLGCHIGNCRSDRGTRFAHSRIQAAGDMLVQMKLTHRIHMEHVAANEPNRLSDTLQAILGKEEKNDA